MPTIVKHTISKRDYSLRELLDEKLISDFIETFFCLKVVESHKMPLIESLRHNLEIS